MLLSFENPAADCVCVCALLLYNQPTQYVAIGAYHPHLIWIVLFKEILHNKLCFCLVWKILPWR